MAQGLLNRLCQAHLVKLKYQGLLLDGVYRLSRWMNHTDQAAKGRSEYREERIHFGVGADADAQVIAGARAGKIAHQNIVLSQPRKAVRG